MKVRALSMGFYRGARVRPGAVFELQEGDKPGKWMADPETGEPLVGGVVRRDPNKVMKKRLNKQKQPTTFSEMTRMFEGGSTP